VKYIEVLTQNIYFIIYVFTFSSICQTYFAALKVLIEKLVKQGRIIL